MTSIDHVIENQKKANRELKNQVIEVLKALTKQEVSIIKHHLISCEGHGKLYKTALRVFRSAFVDISEVTPRGSSNGEYTLELLTYIQGRRARIYAPTSAFCSAEGKERWLAGLATDTQLKKQALKQGELRTMKRLMHSHRKEAREYAKELSK